MWIQISPCQDCLLRSYEMSVYDNTDTIKFKHLVRPNSLVVSFTTLVQAINQLMETRVTKYVIEGSTYTNYYTAVNILTDI